MKKSFLLFPLLCLAMALNAQSQERLKLSDLAQHPELLTPEIAYTLSKQRPDADGYLPPLVAGPFNLRDSFYNYSWNTTQNAWVEKTKNYENRDCDSGRLLSVLNRAKDSSTGLFINKTLGVYEWYPSGKTRNYYRYTWDADMPNGWVQTLYDTSNQDGNSLETWSKMWNQFDNVYVGGERIVSNYDATGNLTDSHEFEFEPFTNTWIATYNTIYSYSNGDIVSIVRDAFDFDSNTWAPINRQEYTYNGEGQLISILFQNYDGNGWTNDRLYTTSYNAAGLAEEELIQIFDAGNWLNTFKYTRTFYPSNADKQELRFKWNNNQQAWVETDRDSVDESGNILYRINKSYDVDDDVFYGGFLVEYTYDNAGLLAQYEISELVFGTQNEWENLELNTYSYDANGQEQEVIRQVWAADLGDYVNSNRTYNFNTGCLFNSTSTTIAKPASCYHANPIMLGQPIYCTSFESNEELSLSLYSMTGTLVSSGAFQSGQALSAGVGPGMYVVSIRNKKGEAYRAKLVVVE